MPNCALEATGGALTSGETGPLAVGRVIAELGLGPLVKPSGLNWAEAKEALPARRTTTSKRRDFFISISNGLEVA